MLYHPISPRRRDTIRSASLTAVIFAVAALAPACAATLPVVAAENFYGDVAEQVGGPDIAVTSILSNPDQDPHLFQINPATARTLSAARIVVYNGLDYDPWMARLLRAAPRSDRAVIVAGDVMRRRPGDNPHLWYDPQTMPAVAAALADALARADPTHAADYRRRLARFRASLAPIDARISTLRARLAGTPVTATEPVFGYMLAALGMPVENARFQLSVMNDTEPRASDVIAFEDSLKNRRVRLLVYNSQASGPVAARMVRLARAAGIPIVGASETEPPGTHYQAWIMRTLDAVDRALPPP